MSPVQIRSRLDEISSQVDRAASLVQVGEMAVSTLSKPIERDALAELLHAVATRLEHIAAAVHDLPAAA